jgi:hypothetical protein
MTPTTILGPNGPIALQKAKLPTLLAYGVEGSEQALLVVKELVRRRRKREAKRLAKRATG